MNARAALYAEIMEALPRLVFGMLHKLSVHIGKGPWSQTTLEYRLAKLDEEVAELKTAIRMGADPESIWDEASDVANMAMILAHSYTIDREVIDMEKELGQCGYINQKTERCTQPLGHKDGHSYV